MIAKDTKRLVVLISGGGSNLQAIIDAISTGHLKQVEIALVVSNRAKALGLDRAKLANIPTLYFPLKPFLNRNLGRNAYDAELANLIVAQQPDLIVCAGWMHILNQAFVEQFAGQIINLHPALPGVLPGKDSLTASFLAAQRGEPIPTGCMVHMVVPEVDAGRVVDMEYSAYVAGDTLEIFSERMHATERRLLVRAIPKALAELSSHIS